MVGIEVRQLRGTGAWRALMCRVKDPGFIMDVMERY